MTLRQLCWARAGRLERAGELVAWLACVVIARLPHNAAVLDPAEVNPYRVVRAKSRAMDELLAWQKARRWRLRCGGA